jgi:hypothetical protein
LDTEFFVGEFGTVLTVVRTPLNSGVTHPEHRPGPYTPTPLRQGGAEGEI